MDLDGLLRELVTLEKLHRSNAEVRGRASEFRYFGFPSVVLDLGRVFTREDLPGDTRLGDMGFCYQNAFQSVFEGRNYVEGYAARAGIPVIYEHAWVTDPAGRAAYDVTWPDGDVYVGIPFHEDFVMERARKRGKYGIFEEGRDELYVHGLPDGAVLDLGQPLPDVLPAPLW